jgi:hypothetical protein
LLVFAAGVPAAEADEFLGGSDWASEAHGEIRAVRRKSVVNLDAFMGTTLGGKVIPRRRFYFGKKSAGVVF